MSEAFGTYPASHAVNGPEAKADEHEVSTSRALEVILSRVRLDTKTATILRSQLAWERLKMRVQPVVIAESAPGFQP